MNRAKEFISGKKYKEAKEAAEQTATLAQQAISQADSTKAKMKTEAEQMLQGRTKGDRRVESAADFHSLQSKS